MIQHFLVNFLMNPLEPLSWAPAYERRHSLVAAMQEPCHCIALGTRISWP